MLADGIATARGRSGAYLHRDQVNGRPARAARRALAAITSGGAIPETANYQRGRRAGRPRRRHARRRFRGRKHGRRHLPARHDSWRIRRVEAGACASKTRTARRRSIPFWNGEAPGRTIELSHEVSRSCASRSTSATTQAAIELLLERECGLDRSGAEQAVAYVRAGKPMLGVVPTDRTWSPSASSMKAAACSSILHAPFGARINRAWGLALRKRFCRSFNFELQAAATDNGIVHLARPSSTRFRSKWCSSS